MGAFTRLMNRAIYHQKGWPYADCLNGSRRLDDKTFGDGMPRSRQAARRRLVFETCRGLAGQRGRVQDNPPPLAAIVYKIALLPPTRQSGILTVPATARGKGRSGLPHSSASSGAKTSAHAGRRLAAAFTDENVGMTTWVWMTRKWRRGSVPAYTLFSGQYALERRGCG